MRISLSHLTRVGRLTMVLGTVLSVSGVVAYQLWSRTRLTAIILVPAREEPPTSLPTRIDFQREEPPVPVPELSFVGRDGRSMTLADFRGRSILLNVWATLCVPCRREMPALDRLQAKLGSPAFQVVALSIDHGGVPAVQEFHQALGLKALGIYVDQSGKTTSDLKIAGVPATLLIDLKGREIGRKLGPAAWDSPEAVDAIRQQIDSTSEARTQQAGESGKP